MKWKNGQPYKKLNFLTDSECMETVHDIRRNYRLPKEGRTVGEMLAVKS